MKRTILLAALVAVAAPLAAGAQSAYRFELTPQVSYRWGGTISGDSTALFDTDLKVDSGVGYGLTFDIPLSQNFQLELLANHQATELQFDEGIFGGNFAVADIDVDYYHVGMLWQGSHGQVLPFFVASAGVTRLATDVPGSSSDERFSLSLGGGVKVFVSENIGFRFEGRGFFTVIDDYQGGCYDYCCSCYDYGYSDTLSQGQVSAGVIFGW